MSRYKGYKVAVIGVGGMGIRHIKAYQKLGIEVVAICDTNEASLNLVQKQTPNAKAYKSVDHLIDKLDGNIDMISVVTNTPSRAKILLALVQTGIKRVLTEKPFTTNLADAYAVTKAYEQANIQLTVNTFRHFCDNHIRLRELIRSGKLGEPRHITIQSASTGLGNMGSVFFDVMNFYLESNPVEVIGVIDQTGTPSVRGSQFRDPGGFGVVRYENGARGFIDTSEDTSIPYTFHIVTKYGRIFIDELFNQWQVMARSEEDKKNKPITFYLTPLVEIPFQLTHGYDTVEMTSFAISTALDDLPEANNVYQAVKVMEMIIAMHTSYSNGCIPTKLPLDRNYHTTNIPFA